jgi:hypothetical protein
MGWSLAASRVALGEIRAEDHEGIVVGGAVLAVPIGAVEEVAGDEPRGRLGSREPGVQVSVAAVESLLNQTAVGRGAQSGIIGGDRGKRRDGAQQSERSQ